MEHLHYFIVLLVLFYSPWQSDGKMFLTHLETPCVEDCTADGGEFSCKTIDKDGATQTMFCSPRENVDYRGRQCRADSVCEKRGENYCWCRTGVFSWGYCGLVKDDAELSDAGKDSHITSRLRIKRALEEEIIASVDDSSHRKRTVFRALEASQYIKDVPTEKMRNDAQKLIAAWTEQHLSSQGKSNLIKSDDLRIDMQGIIERKGIDYYNLQIQTNKRPSYTVSQIFVPAGVLERYIRRAFLESLDRRARIFIDVEYYSKSEKGKN